MNKKKIIILGNGPILNKNTLKMNAYSLRSIQFFEGLKDLNPVMILVDDESNYSNSKLPKDSKNIFHVKSYKSAFRLISKLKPEFLITCNNIPSYEASKRRKNYYLVCDLNGWMLSEGQIWSKLFNNNFSSRILRYKENKILKKADFITTVSDPQKFATIGELAILGFLNKENTGKELVQTIENGQTTCYDSVFNSNKINLDLPKNSFKVLWLSGFNNWTDEQTLFKGIEKSIMKNPKIHLILTGGEIAKMPNQKFNRFKKLVEESKVKHNIHFLGWIDYLDIKSLVEECDLGISSDLNIYETEFGGRNRINEFFKYKTPVLTSKGSQIANFIQTIDRDYVFESENYNDLAKKLLKLSQGKLNLQLVNSFNKKYLNNDNLLDPIKKYIDKPFISKKGSLDLWNYIKSKI